MICMTDRRLPESDADWWRISFDDLYPVLYRHRDLSEAETFVSALTRLSPLSGGRILDLGCGAGRYLQALARRAAEPIGLDFSWPLLERARELLPGTPLVRADMRALPLRESSFSWVLMMFTTFGYFATDQENIAVLSAVERLLSPGGRFALDYVNARNLRSNLVGESSRTVDGVPVTERRWIDPTGPFVRKETRIGTGSEQRVYHERLRLYDPAEIDRHLVATGFTIEEIFGDYDGRPFKETDSPRLILIARAKESPQ